MIDPSYYALFLVPTIIQQGIVYYGLYIRKRIKLRIYKKWSYSIVQLQPINYPKIINVKHNNIDALINKGYKTYNDNPYNLYYDHCWNNLQRIDTRYDKNQQFLNDCKGADINTEIIYEYMTIFGNYKQKNKTLYWSKYINELE